MEPLRRRRRLGSQWGWPSIYISYGYLDSISQLMYRELKVSPSQTYSRAASIVSWATNRWPDQNWDSTGVLVPEIQLFSRTQQCWRRRPPLWARECVPPGRQSLEGESTDHRSHLIDHNLPVSGITTLNHHHMTTTITVRHSGCDYVTRIGNRVDPHRHNMRIARGKWINESLTTWW